MKKFLSLLLVAVLVSAMFAVPVSADDEMYWAEGEYDLIKDNNVDPHHAWGYKFTIDTFNSISGNTTAVFTTAEGYASAGKWSAKAVFAPTDEANVYELVAAYQITSKTGSEDIADGIVDFSKGQIVLVAQDSGTRPEKNEDGTLKYPNWEERAAIWGLVHTPGAKATLAGIDVAAGTMTDGTVTIEAAPSKVEDDKDDEEVIEISNVALDKEYKVSGAGDYVETYVGNLTDGIVGEDLSEGKEAIWYALYHNGDRANNAPDKLGYFIIDLEDEYTLTSIKVNFINKNAWGIVPPEYAKAYVSLDGNAFEEVGEFEISSEEDVAYWSDIEVNAKAKFVKIEVKLGGTFAFLSEIEVYGGKGVAGGSTEEPKEDLEALLKEALGEKPADAKLDFVIDAPETYEAGDEITVTVTVKNITAESGIHVVEFKLYYDNEKLLLTNDLDEDDNNAVLCVENLPDKWENFSRVNNDGGENSEDGTVLPLNDGVIIGSILTDNPNAKYAVKEDDVIVFTFTFKALEDAEGDIGLVIPHAEAEGAVNTDMGADVYEANGDYAVIKAPVVEDPSKPDDTKPGDASNMIIFAIIAIVALAGSAVVIKTRR